MINIENWSNINYSQAHKKQLDYLHQRINEEISDTIIICSHPPVVTLGKKSEKKEDIVNYSGELFEIERGGRATYHGPGQVVIYPILNIKEKKYGISGLLKALEQATIACLKTYNIDAKGNNQRGNEKLTGVWVDGKKIASIGIAVKRWVSYHGIAINLYHDPQAFKGISPCGYNNSIMTSIEEIIGHKVNRESFEKSIIKQLINILDNCH